MRPGTLPLVALILVAGVIPACSHSMGGTVHRSTIPEHSSRSPTGSPLQLVVRGNRLVDTSGRTVRLLGVDLSGAEYACIQSIGFFDTPTDDRQIGLIASWHVNVVRVPLNEDCWLGVNAPPPYSGAAYRAQILGLVARLHRHGMFVILDLHWNAPDGEPATGLRRMADADHSPAFWRSIAQTFRSDHAVLFDLYNEPHNLSWACWRDGCLLRGPYQEADDREPRSFNAAGMQQLVDAIRGTGATQPLMVGGNNWANDLTRWPTYLAHDPLGQLVASFHLYNFNECIDVTCWNRTIAPIAQTYPVVSGEIGEDDCAHGFIDRYMAWADQQGVSYLAWQWGAFDCRGGPSLISNYDGTSTPFGEGFRQHLLTLKA